VLGHDAILAIENCLPIDGDLADALDAIVLGMLQIVEDLGVEEQRLRRNAAPVEAGAMS
jgi:hypothetical protein